MANNPSVKQFRVIQMIENNTSHVFTGNTMNDAREFISEHIEESKESSRIYKEESSKGLYISSPSPSGEDGDEDTRIMFSVPNPNIRWVGGTPIYEPPHKKEYDRAMREEPGDNHFAWGTGLGDVTGERQNNGHFGMPDDY